MTSALLVGYWKADPADVGAFDEDSLVTLLFSDDGELTYAIQSTGGLQVILLRYRIEGDQLVTDQPSAPREERTAWAIDGAGRLTLTFGGVVSTFIRIA
jgi:hypothetical protein